MTERTRLTVLQVALLLGVCAFLFFFGLGAFGLVGADEPRYAQIAREMLGRHDWIVPTLNGSPWLEKPALLYWKIINSFMILGVEDWAARVPAAFHATALTVTVFFFMRRFRSGSELDAALITASMAAVIGFARGASTDMLLSAPLSISLLAWWAWHETGRKLWLAIFYAFLAIGALAKGPIAPALALLIVAAYAGVRRDGKIFLRSLWIPGFLLFFAIVLPWYLAVQIKVPQFFRVFFIGHNLERFGTNLYQHSQPFWYYIPVFLLGTLPWTWYTGASIVRAAWRTIQTFREAVTSDKNFDQLESFMLVWIAVTIIFFSISRSKLPGYILPSFPAAAVLTANWLHSPPRQIRWIQGVQKLLLVLHSLLCAALMAGALLAPWAMLHQPLPDRTKTIIIVTSGVIAILVLVMVRSGGLRLLHFATLIPVVLALAFLLRPAARVIDNTLSARTVELQLRQLGVKESMPIAVFSVRRDVAYGLNFYRNQPITYYDPDGPRDLPSGIPAQEHVVIAREGNSGAVQAVVSPRQITRLGDFPLQHLEFFLVSNLK